jgi:hypothetical protein
MIHKLFIIILMACMFNSCNSSEITKDEKINGMQELELVQKLNKPKRETIIPIHKKVNLLEYQSDLFELTQDLTESDTIYIKELYWEHKKTKQVVWLKKIQAHWIVFDNLIWSNKIQF